MAADPHTPPPQQVGAPVDGAFQHPPSALSLWLRSDFPWLFRPWRAAVVGLTLVLLVLGAQQAVSRLSRPPPQPVQAEVQALRALVSLVEECRGTESLLVLLPRGAERDAAIDRLHQQQAGVGDWLQRHDGWLVAAHGRASVDQLAAAAGTWHALQLRIVAAPPGDDRGGQTNASRVLTTGPSADAYATVVASVEGMLRRHRR
ncbi:hypothetical protein [Pseudaquabacterium pictum]|uniref:Uncharacterized protein n=1 Tax=Pseudaquabacterium pictum TaxID=2315236 RepID=A0A480AM18_9BURK|nr:hypothetical protein [Rubrivivax pictus]GCL61790.1 hypothetical protein AQPW35_08710 [Rubrivivax pictus]